MELIQWFEQLLTTISENLALKKSHIYTDNIKRLKDYMDDHFNEDLAVTDIARKANMSTT